MPDVSRRSFAGLLGASITASQLPLVISGCSSASTATAPDPAQGWYIDGLSFLPADLNDIRASKIDAFICDISAIEQVWKPTVPSFIVAHVSRLNKIIAGAWPALMLDARHVFPDSGCGLR